MDAKLRSMEKEVNKYIFRQDGAASSVKYGTLVQISPMTNNHFPKQVRSQLLKSLIRNRTTISKDLTEEDVQVSRAAAPQNEEAIATMSCEREPQPRRIKVLLDHNFSLKSSAFGLDGPRIPHAY